MICPISTSSGKSMETLKERLGKDTWLILSTDSELLRYLKSTGN